MGSFVGVLRVNEATVICADVITEAAQPPNLFRINRFNVALILDDLEAGTSLCEKYLKRFESIDGGFDEIIDEVRQSLEKNVSDYHEKLMTICFVGYESDFRERQYYALKFDGQRITANPYPSDNKILFLPIYDLGAYLAIKVYSNHMSLDKAVDLMGYIASQYNKIFNIQKYVSIATITKDGFNQLDIDRIRNVRSKAEEVDLDIRKTCCDFFITESS